MVLIGHHTVKIAACFNKFVFHPVQRCCRQGVMLARPQNKLHSKGRRNHRISGFFQKHINIRCLPVNLRQHVCKAVSCITALSCQNNAIRNTPQIFNQDKPETDGRRPQFTNAERLDILIGIDKIAEGTGIKMAVGVRHVSPHNTKYARVPGKMTIRKFGQLAIEASRQIRPGLMDMLFDQMIVVNQPLSGWRHTFSCFDGT